MRSPRGILVSSTTPRHQIMQLPDPLAAEKNDELDFSNEQDDADVVEEDGDELDTTDDGDDAWQGRTQQ